MAADWFYAKDGERYGPFDAQQIKQFAAQGVLLPTDAVTRKGMAQWMPAHTVKGLFAESTQIAMQSQSPAAEVRLYQDDDVVVTTDRIVLGDTVINMHDIVNATVEDPPNAIERFTKTFGSIDRFIAVLWILGLVYVVLGVLLMWWFLYTSQQGERNLIIVFFSFFGFLAAAAFFRHAWFIKRNYRRYRSSRRLIIKTTQERLEALVGHEKSVIVAVASAINDALRRCNAS